MSHQWRWLTDPLQSRLAGSASHFHCLYWEQRGCFWLTLGWCILTLKVVRQRVTAMEYVSHGALCMKQQYKCAEPMGEKGSGTLSKQETLKGTQLPNPHGFCFVATDSNPDN